MEGVLDLLAEVTGKGADFKGSEGDGGAGSDEEADLEHWKEKNAKAVAEKTGGYNMESYPIGGHPDFSEEEKLTMMENAWNSGNVNPPPDWPGPGRWADLPDDHKKWYWQDFAYGGGAGVYIAAMGFGASTGGGGGAPGNL